LIAYLDTSALVKLMLDEEGSADAVEIWTGATLRLTSVLSYAECRAALGAAGRDGRLTSADARKARVLLDDHWYEMAVVGVDDDLVRAAGDLADGFALRGYDAVHLASALSAAWGGRVLMATWDADLARAALGSGLLVAPAP
jgi:predicted nucleic acid-binding protein